MLRPLFGNKARPVAPTPADVNQQAVLVFLNGTDLPQEVYDKCDLATIEDRLTEAINSQRLGEFDGNEIGPAEAILYMYGPDAELLFRGIEPTLRAYPLCQGARVVVRHGGPGAPEREIHVDAA